MRASDRSTSSVLLAVVLATLTVTPLTEDWSFLGASWLLMLLLTVVSAVLRRSTLAATAVLAAQLVVWVAFVLALNASFPRDVGGWLENLLSAWSAGIHHMQTQASPMDPNDGVTLIFVSVIGLIWILTDLLVSGLKHPAWAILPPAAMFAVPAVGLGTDTGAGSFLLIGVGYLAILLAEGLNTTGRWTRGLSWDSAGSHGTASSVVWRAAALIGAPALVLTLVFGTLLPTFSLSGFGFGAGAGGNGPLQLTDPTLDLKRNLTQPRDKVVISYKSDKPGGLYLRLASLPRFNSSGWSNVPMQLEPGEQLPQIPGLSLEPSVRRQTTISVLDFKSEYLPLPFAPRSINAAGSWASDPKSLVMLSMNRGDRANAIRNLTYTVTSVDISPDAKDLANAGAGTPVDSGVTGDSPDDLPQTLVKLTQQVTEKQSTAAGKAEAIQAYLRGNQFTYSTEALPGSGYQALENFLLKDRQGYCEQFATAMAMMARIVGIPSRVAVGFLPGERKGDHYEVTIRDMHAWPELYFAGYGWVRFEPTPGSVSGAPPAWTVPRADTPSDEASAAPSEQASTQANAPSARPDKPLDEQTTETATGSAFPWGKTLLGSGIGLVALLVLAAPATIRGRRRSGRLGADGPAEERVEAAWQEIRDTVLDYGEPWPEGSPRTISGEIGERLLAGEESTTMTQVATLVERSRYARSFPDSAITQSLPAMAQEIRRGIAQPQSRWRRVRALVIPRSLFRRGR